MVSQIGLDIKGSSNIKLHPVRFESQVEILRAIQNAASFREARNPDIFLFTVYSVWKNLQYNEILIEKTNPDILHQISKSWNPD